MNLHEFFQQTNNEMGIFITKAQDPYLYNATYEEVQRLLTISKEIRVTVKKVTKVTPPKTGTVSIEAKPNNKKTTETNTALPYKVLISNG
jgi:hypothetical protein